MADDLYPTKTRLALLKDIAYGRVLTDISRDDDQDVILLFPNAPSEWNSRVRVTVRVRELEQAGWAEEFILGPTWSLTEAGRDVLEAARG